RCASARLSTPSGSHLSTRAEWGGDLRSFGRGERDFSDRAFGEECRKCRGEVEARICAECGCRRFFERDALGEPAAEGEGRVVQDAHHYLTVPAAHLDEDAAFSKAYRLLCRGAAAVGPPDAVDRPGRGEEAQRRVKAEPEPRRLVGCDPGERGSGERRRVAGGCGTAHQPFEPRHIGEI